MQPRIDQLLAESTWVRRIALSLLHHPQDAEDVTQEVLVTAYRQAPSATGASLRAWLRTVTRRKVARKKLLEGRKAHAEREAARTEGPSADPSASVAERMALHGTLAQAVSELPPLLGEAVMLRYFDDKSPRQIAQELGVTSEVVRQRVSRGLKRLRQTLDRESDPSDPERGRELWSAALAESLAPTQLVTLTSLSTLLVMSFQAKALLGVCACAAAALLFWPSNEADSALSNTRVEKTADPVSLSSEEQPTLAILPSDGDTKRLPLEEPAPTIHASTKLQLRNPEGEGPAEARVFWVDPQGLVHPLLVDEAGDVNLEEVPAEERLWIAATGYLSGFVDLEANRTVHEYTLDPGLTILGLFIEDGGVPRARTSLYVRWTTPYLAELEQDRVPEKQWEELRLGFRGEGIRPDAQGRLTLTGQYPETELRISLPSSHVFELGQGEDSRNLSVTPLPSETVVLRTLRTLSISARLLRADNGKPVRYCQGFFHFRNRNGDRRGSISGNADGEGIFSEGYLPEGWRELSPAERDAAKRDWIYVQWDFRTNDPSLGKIDGNQKLPGDEFFIDLGDLYLESREVISAQVVGPSGSGLPLAAVRAFGSLPQRANPLGQIRLPPLAREKGVTAIALGHEQRSFSPAELVPNEEGLIELPLKRGIELHLSLAEASYEALERAGAPLSDYLVTVSWDRSPFVRAEGSRDAFDSMLHSEVLDLNEGLMGLTQTEGPQTALSQFPSSGVLRLLSLLPDKPLEISLRSADASILSTVQIRTPKDPGQHRVELQLPSSPPRLKADEFLIRGEVLDERDLPVTNATLIYWIDGITGRVNTDEEGRFESGPLRKRGWPTENPFRIYFLAEGHVRIQQEWPDFAADELSQLQFRQPRSRRLEVSAVTAEGEPMDIDSLEHEQEGLESLRIEWKKESGSSKTWICEEAPQLPLNLKATVDGSSHSLQIGAEGSSAIFEIPARRP